MNELMLNPSNAEVTKAQGRSDFWKKSQPCHVGIHWKGLDGSYQMSTHLPGFQPFCRDFASFHIDPVRVSIRPSFLFIDVSERPIAETSINKKDGLIETRTGSTFHIGQISCQ